MEALVSAVEGLRDAVAEASLPLEVPSRAPAEASRRQLLQQLDDYVLPRLRSIDAPLLAVVGGSTGAGKSTLVNSVVGREVSRSGVLRPTTTSPVLVHHPDDRRWFEDNRILPGLARVTGEDTRGVPAGHRAAGRVDRAPGRDGPARRPRHRLGRLRQPHDRDPAAVGIRPLALRHHRRALRGCRAVGLPAHRRRPRHRRRDRPRPHPARGRGGDPPAPREHAARAGAADRPDLHRAGDRARRGRAPARGCRRAAAFVAAGPRG